MHKLITTDYSEARMMQVINLPYLLQSLVSAKAANCVQPQSKGTVHHYPANCNGGDIMEDRSSTANSVRMDYQCAGENGAARNGMAVVQVKREVMNDQTETGCSTQYHYTHCPRDTYCNYQTRYTVVYPPDVRCQQKVTHTPSVTRTNMSLDIDSIFTPGLSPLGLSEQSSYYSATSSMADFSSIYDLPAQTSPDKTAFDVMGGNSEDICSPVFTKMDPSCELLSLDSLGDSEFGYEDYLSSDVANSLDQDWLIEPVSLPSPEEQDSDIKYSLSATATPAVPPQSLPLTLVNQFCVNSSPPSSASATSSCMLTPDPSLPPSPVSILSYSSEEEEIKDVLASFNDDGSCLDFPMAVQPFAPSQMLPFSPNPQLLDVTSPSSSLTSSPPSPEESNDGSSFDTIHGFLDQSESSSPSLSLPSLAPPPVVIRAPAQSSSESVSGSTGRSRKRKSLPISSDQQSSAPAPASKRRISKAVKKERKREQNKTAALRYRQKKKEEKVDIEVQRAELEDTNKKLKGQVTSLSNEINYLKKLWLEVCEHKKTQKSL